MKPKHYLIALIVGCTIAFLFNQFGFAYISDMYYSKNGLQTKISYHDIRIFKFATFIFANIMSILGTYITLKNLEK